MKPADKGGATVILNTGITLRKLKNTNFLHASQNPQTQKSQNDLLSLPLTAIRRNYLHM